MPRDLREISDEESMALLGSVSLGRIGFSLRALPAIRPVNHILDNGDIVIRSHFGAEIVTAADSMRGVVVAYEADQFDLDEGQGWSVVVTGVAVIVRDPAQVARYRSSIHPWVNGQMDYVLRIHPEIITGLRLG